MNKSARDIGSYSIAGIAIDASKDGKVHTWEWWRREFRRQGLRTWVEMATGKSVIRPVS